MRRIVPLAALLAAFAVAPTTAGAAANANVIKVRNAYLANAGSVPACKFTTQQLNDARRHLTRDILQYAPDLEDAINTALEQRATGACKKKSGSSAATTAGTAAAGTGGSGSNGSGSGTTPATTTQGGTSSTPTTTPAAGTTAPATTTPQPAPTVDPAPAVNNDAIPAAAIGAPDTGADDAPAPLLVLALMLGLLAVLGALWWAVRWMGFNPPWLQRWRHASHEAGWRASAAWSEFTDWVRLGR